jgi:hypothetical protein
VTQLGEAAEEAEAEELLAGPVEEGLPVQQWEVVPRGEGRAGEGRAGEGRAGEGRAGAVEEK